MRKLLILGTLLLSSCSAYRIQVNKTEDQTYYTPSHRVGIHWVEHYASFQTQKLAEGQIQSWKADKAFQKHNKSQYIYFK